MNISDNNKICPLCNGLKDYELYCEKCGANMKNGGNLANYYDSYSPYFSDIMPSQEFIKDRIICIHLFYCPICGNDKQIPIECIST